MNDRAALLQLFGIGVVIVATLLCYTITPTIGASVLILFDYAAFGFRWFGIHHPSAAWLLMGSLMGALFGLNTALRRLRIGGVTGKIVFCGASAFVLLCLLSFLYCNTMKPVVPANAPQNAAPGFGSAPPTTANPFSTRTVNE